MFPFYFVSERNCSLVPGRGCRPGRGAGWGDSFQGGPNPTPAARRRPGRRVRQERARTIPTKKGTFRPGGTALQARPHRGIERTKRRPEKVRPRLGPAAFGKTDDGQGLGVTLPPRTAETCTIPPDAMTAPKRADQARRSARAARGLTPRRSVRSQPSDGRKI